MNTLKKKEIIFAFTLSEVLITLGIIGIIAAITIPVLMNNIKDQQLKTAYKKAYSIAANALDMANQQNLIVATTGEGDGNHAANFLAFMSQFQTTKTCLNNDYENCWDDSGEKFAKMWFATGFPQHSGMSSSAFIDNSGMAWCNYYWGYFILLVDTNGFKPPNQYGKDRFAFYLLSSSGTSKSGQPIKVIPLIDNGGLVCQGNKCGTAGNPDYNTYFGTSWLYN